MPIDENVLDHVAQLMAHYFAHYPDEAEVTAAQLAAMIHHHGVCDIHIKG